MESKGLNLYGIERRSIALDFLDMNEGQVPGLGRNPRQWTFGGIEKLKKSIEETPDLLQACGIIVFPYEGRYVAIGGNMRLCALKSMGAGNAPCIVLPEDTPIEKLREIVIKDNATFGEWIEGMLKAEWSDCPLADWGVETFDDYCDDSLSEEEKKAMEDIRKVFEVELSPQEFAFVQDRLRMYDQVPEVALLKLIGYGE